MLEHLGGRNLGQIIRQDGPLDPARAMAFAIQACGALQEAHEKGIIHRDVKPENIYLCGQRRAEDTVKVLDFGIAKVTEREMGPGSYFMTVEQAVFGTPEFMSPEQAKGRSIDGRSDIYSLAMTLYESVTGRLPWEVDSPMGHTWAQIHETPIPPSERAPEIAFPSGFDEVVLKALSKRPEDRYESATEFAAAIAAVLERSDRDTSAFERGAISRRVDARTDVSAPPLTDLGDARLGVIRPTNARAHESLRASARIAADSEGDRNARAADAKRRTSAIEAINAIEHTLFARLERAKEDAAAVASLRRALPSPGAKNTPFAQRRLIELLDGGRRPSVAALAQSMVADRGAPALAETVRVVLGVPEALVGDVAFAGALRIILAHRSEYEIDDEASLDVADGWVERVSSGYSTEIRVLPAALERLTWLSACLLERRVRPRA